MLLKCIIESKLDSYSKKHENRDKTKWTKKKLDPHVTNDLMSDSYQIKGKKSEEVGRWYNHLS